MLKKSRRIAWIFIILIIFPLRILVAQTTVTDGNWSNPTTWGGVPPTGTGTVVIDHDVILDVDYSHTDGSVTINASGSLAGNSDDRFFAINYPNGSASLAVYGLFNVARVPVLAGVVQNHGNFQADSLLSSSWFTNDAGAILTVNAFTNSSHALLLNKGTVVADNFFNQDSVVNESSMTIVDFANTKGFFNSALGTMNITHDFANVDSVAGPALFTTDGDVVVYNNWHNGNMVQGTGKFCVGNFSWNSGTMSGTFDFCDETGGGVDLNTGVIEPSVTICHNPCHVGIGRLSILEGYTLSPNPFSLEMRVECGNYMSNLSYVVYNSLGQVVRYAHGIKGETFIFRRENLPDGIYHMKVEEDGGFFRSVTFLIRD